MKIYLRNLFFLSIFISFFEENIYGFNFDDFYERAFKTDRSENGDIIKFSFFNSLIENFTWLGNFIIILMQYS